MGHSKTLTFAERLAIERLLKQGISCSSIAKILGRGKNCIVVEVRRSGGPASYNGKQAQKESEIRAKERIKKTTGILKSKDINPWRPIKDAVIELQAQIESINETIEIILNQIRGRE